jgi:hypothetical protein
LLLEDIDSEFAFLMSLTRPGEGYHLPHHQPEQHDGAKRMLVLTIPETSLSVFGQPDRDQGHEPPIRKPRQRKRNQPHQTAIGERLCVLNGPNGLNRPHGTTQPRSRPGEICPRAKKLLKSFTTEADISCGRTSQDLMKGSEMNTKRLAKLVAGLSLVGSVVGITTQESAHSAEAPAVVPVTIAKTWTGMNLGSMPWGDNSGSKEFKRHPFTGSYFTNSTNEFLMGNWFGSKWRSFTQFDPSLFTGKTISKATLHLPVSSCGTALAQDPYLTPIMVRRLTGPFWYGQAMPGPAFGTDSVSVLPVADDYATVDITDMVKIWTDRTKNFGLSFDLGTATNSYCKAQRQMTSGKSAFIELSYDVNPPFLSNTSFETGAAGWRACFKADTVSYSTPSGWNALDGQNILRFNSTAGSGSMCQTKQRKPLAGDFYQLALRVRSASGKPINGTASLWELRPETEGGSWETHVDFVATSAWKEVRTSACARNADAIALKTEIYVGTPNENLDVDFVEVAIGNPSVCSKPAVVVAPSATVTTTTIKTLVQ